MTLPQYDWDGWIVEYVTPFAQQGVPEAQYMLGVLHQTGLGVDLNAERAEYWFIQATTSDFPIAGVLGQIDIPRAKSCYRRAADLGGPTNGDYL